MTARKKSMTMFPDKITMENFMKPDVLSMAISGT
jgi:hypothetical protein